MSGRGELGLMGRHQAGMGDIDDPLQFAILPGSQRKPPPGLNERGDPLPGMPGSPSPEDVLRSILGGLPVAEVPFSVWQVNTYLIGTTNAILVDEPFRRNRRVVVITNVDAANDVWVGPDSTTRVNFGEKIPPLGSRSFPLRELVRLYAISNAAGTIVAISQFAT
jgi:hypothetical protein